MRDWWRAGWVIGLWFSLRRRLVPMLPVAFIATATPTLVAFALLTPPGYVPDESTHLVRAASLLHGEIAGRRAAVTKPDGRPGTIAGITVDPALAWAGNPFPLNGPRVFTRASLDRLQGLHWTGSLSFVAVPNTAQYFPILYLPAAVAIAFIHAIRARPLVALHAARLVNALCYLVLGSIALGAARRGRGLLFATLAMPMTLYLAASASQEGLLIAASCTGMALLTAAEAGGRGEARALTFGCVALGSVMLVKPPYLPLAAALLADARLADWRRWRRRLLLGVAITVPAMLWSVFVASAVSSPFYITPYHPGPLYAGDHAGMFWSTDAAAQVRVLLADPARLLTLPIRSLIHDLPSLWHEMIGILGWIDVQLPDSMYRGWGVALAAALVADLLSPPPSGVARRGAARLGPALMLLGIVACVLLIYLVQYVTWTGVGMTRVDGVQGRYFLPLLPFLALALPRLPLPSLAPGWRVGLQRACLVPAVAMAASDVVRLPLLIVFRMYLR